MYSPTTRLLTLLELLQSRGSVSGPEIAAKLEVDVRSVRRYITMLRDMGIPVDSEQGRYGTYFLRPGFRLPPLMFNNSEIQAIILGLMAVRELGLAATIGVESASAKIERVLPDELRERMRATQSVLTFNMQKEEAISEELLASFSIAAYQRTQLSIRYQGRGDATERAIDVYGLVYHTGYWYSVAFCHLRNDIRSFRLDRVQSAQHLETPFEPPPHFNALDYLMNSIASIPGFWQVEVLLKTTLDRARHHVPSDMAIINAVEDGVMMRLYSDGLDWLARFLINTGVPFVIHQPPELRDKLRELAQRMITIADQV